MFHDLWEYSRRLHFMRLSVLVHKKWAKRPEIPWYNCIYRLHNRSAFHQRKVRYMTGRVGLVELTPGALSAGTINSPGVRQTLATHRPRAMVQNGLPTVVEKARVGRGIERHSRGPDRTVGAPLYRQLPNELGILWRVLERLLDQRLHIVLELDLLELEQQNVAHRVHHDAVLHYGYGQDGVWLWVAPDLAQTTAVQDVPDA